MKTLKTIVEYGALATIATAMVAIVGLDLYIAFTSGTSDFGLSRAGMLLSLITG
jgi:hypothetical protein